MRKLNPVYVVCSLVCLAAAVAAAAGGVWLWAGILTASAGSHLFAAWIGTRS